MGEIVVLSIALTALIIGAVCTVRPTSETARQAYVLIFGGGVLVFGFLGPCALISAPSAQNSGFEFTFAIWIVGIAATVCALACLWWLWRNR